VLGIPYSLPSFGLCVEFLATWQCEWMRGGALQYKNKYLIINLNRLPAPYSPIPFSLEIVIIQRQATNL
jgi:hypothetical protein